MVASDNAFQVLPLFQPYTNVPPFEEGSYFHDDTDVSCGDEKSRSDGVYGPRGISEEVEEYQIFKSKRDFNTTLSLISMREKFSFKIFYSNTLFVVA